MKMIIQHFKDASQKNLTRDTEVQKKFWQFKFSSIQENGTKKTYQ